MVTLCVECSKELAKDEWESGFCADCNAKIENDMRILRECEDGNFAFHADLTI
jgi:predicted amidophosphoribosyltransferase